MKQIPNIFTLLNLFLGGLAIIYALQTNSVIIYLDQNYNSSFNIPERLAVASVFIIAAAVVDFLDGFVARLLNATSELGKQLDSLSDVVSFGVAPSVIVYQLLRLSFAREEGGLDVSGVVLMPALVIACAAAFRLGKFNLATDQQYTFKGVPVPAVGLLIASFPLMIHYGSFSPLNPVIINKWFLYLVILIVSFLMVSNLRMLSLKFGSGSKLKDHLPKLILLLLAIIAAIFFKWAAVPVVFILYILFSLFTSQKTT